MTRPPTGGSLSYLRRPCTLACVAGSGSAPAASSLRGSFHIQREGDGELVIAVVVPHVDRERMQIAVQQPMLCNLRGSPRRLTFGSGEVGQRHALFVFHEGAVFFAKVKIEAWHGDAPVRRRRICGKRRACRSDTRRNSQIARSRQRERPPGSPRFFSRLWHPKRTPRTANRRTPRRH